MDLEYLLIQENGISEISGLETLKVLDTLDLSFNQLTKINNLQDNQLLKDLWLNMNKIRELSDLNGISEIKNSIKCIYLQNCPVSHKPGYRQHVIELAPDIEQVDTFRRNIQFVIKKEPLAPGMKKCLK